MGSKWGVVAIAWVAFGCKGEEAAPSSSPPTIAKAEELKVEPASPPRTPPPPAPSLTWYRAELDFGKRGPLPFFLALPDASGEGVLQNGEEATPVDVTWTADVVKIAPRVSWISELTATRGADGSLTGSFVRDFPLWSRVERALTAKVVPEAKPSDRFAGETAPAADISGTWKFDFKEHRLGKGKLVMNPDGSVTGFIRPGALGDLRFLAGEMQGKKLLLSQFNGNAANLVTAELSADGKKLTGTMSMYNVWNETFTATRSEDFEYGNRVTLKRGATKLALPQLEKYRGKPVVLVFFATWCPSCNDATPFLVELERKFGPRGVSFLSIAMDLSDEQATLEREIARFKQRHKVPWEVVAVPTTPERWKDDMPPEIEGWMGYPITVFIKPDGTIHATYGGWFGPAAKDENAKLRAQFEAWTDELTRG